MQSREIRLDLADLVVSLKTEPGTRISGYVDSFLVSEPAQVAVTVRLNRAAARAEEDWQQLAVAEHHGWKAFRTGDGRSMLLERARGRHQVRFAAEPLCETVEVLLGTVEEAGSDNPTWPVREHLLVEVLPVPAVVLLSGRHGLFLHSCAVCVEQQGVLFSGVSGSGKSTMAELWRRFAPANSHVIDDEHILARLHDGTPWLYGAPWSRGPLTAAYSRTPLKTVFFISHGTQNHCLQMSHSEALAELMSQVFLPVWSREQLEMTTQTCADLLAQADCYRLPFVPDRKVISFVQEILQHSN